MNYQREEIFHNGMKIFFEFPEPTENDHKIKKEIKEILANVLQEQLQQIESNSPFL